MSTRTSALSLVLAVGLLPVASIGQQEFSAQIGRSQEVPPIPASGGTTTLALSDDGTALTYDIRVSGIPAVAAAHFHNAPADANGGVVRALSGEFDGNVWVSSGVWTSGETDQPLTAALAEEVRAGNIYINIHTADFGAGEIRGQIRSDDDGISAVLARTQAVPPIPAAGGSATLSLNADGTALTYEIRVSGIPAVAASHFHNAAAGTNGGVVRGLSGDFDGDVWVSSSVWEAGETDQPLTAELAAELRAGNIYINIHTGDFGPGEVRGQVLPLSATAVESRTWGTVKSGLGK